MEKQNIKRILIFSTAYAPFIGGAEIAVQEITAKMSDYAFVLLTARLDPRLPERETVGNVDVVRIGKGNRWDKLRLVLQGPGIAAGMGSFSLVWSIMASYSGFAALRFKKKHPQIPYLLTLQEGDSFRSIYAHVWWCWPYFKQIFKRADHIQAISLYLEAWAKRMGATCSVAVLPNGVDTNTFMASSDETRDEASKIVKEKLGIPGEALLVLTVSRLVKKNGIGDLVRAMTYLAPNIHLVVAGSGDMDESLHQSATHLGITDRVHFLGSIDQKEVARYLGASDVFCRPSLSEGLGNAFLEAMAAGVPVVATRVGGIPDFLVHEENGLFCEPRNPKDIAEKMKRLLDDDDLAEHLRRGAYKIVEQNYTWERVTTQMKNLFSSMI